MTSLWELMQAEHDRIWDHLNALTGGPGGREGDAADRQQIAKDLVALASGHEATEEMVVWPVVRERCPDGDDLVGSVIEQEAQMKRAINELAHVSSGNQDFEELCNTIAGAARTHISYEQNQVWPRFADVLSETEAADLAARWQDARRAAPSKPHPHLPASPAMMGLAGRLSRVLGRLRGAPAR